MSYRRAMSVLLLFSFGFMGLSLSERNEEGLSSPSSFSGNFERNPFAPSGGTEVFDLSEFVVNGVVVGEGKGYALISGNVVAKGEMLGRYTVYDIQKDGVVLKEGEETFTLKLR
ncbi:MAG: hypothetical protein Q7S98_05825 [Deltaproteobacteria bacterium]|nr:hypothetical protein [Deltaproteobacteria bacterium]